MKSVAVLVSIFALVTGTSIPRAFNNIPIVGGYEVPIEDIPYQISLHLFTSFICGGSIINQRSILTAAHCTDGLLASRLFVRVGSSFCNSGGKLYGVEKIKQHENYNPTIGNYDISLLKLKFPLVFGVSVQAAVLASSNFIPTDGTPSTVSGFGAISETGPDSLKLLATQVPLISQITCEALGYPYSSITTQMICAGGNGTDSCLGDSGGPLVSGGRQIGIVSWGMGCARPNKPGVYASVAALRNWIDNNLQLL